MQEYVKNSTNGHTKVYLVLNLTLTSALCLNSATILSGEKQETNRNSIIQSKF